MVSRSVRCAAAAALVVVGGLFCTGGAVGATGTGPTLFLVNQSPTVLPPAPGQPAPFQVTVRVSGAPAGAQLGLVVYRKLTTRSDFERTLTSRPTDVMQDVAPAPLSSLHVVGGAVQLGADVVESAQADGSSTIGLRGCTVGNGTCSGVYPVEVVLTDSSGNELAHLTTYIVFAEARSANPLVFSWIVPVAAPVALRTGAPLARAIVPLNKTRVADLAFLTGQLAADPGLAVTVAPSPATVQRLESDGSTAAGQVIVSLRTIGADGPGRLIAQPYVPVNLASLSEAGVATEVLGQTRIEPVIMRPVTGILPQVDQPSFSTWVADGPVTPAITKGLAELHSTRLVLPDTDLPPATELNHASWTQPFNLELGHGTVPAAAIDTQLSSLFTAEPADPALGAYQLLAELAMIQSELPGAPETRGVIAMPPASWDPSPQFVQAFVTGLVGNPVIATATLGTYFKEVPVGGNDAATTRRLGSGPDGERIGAAEAAAIARARTELDALSGALVGAPPVESQLGELLLSAESSELSSSAQKAGLAAFERDLDAALSSIKVVASTVTMTARTATIPITITSSASFALNAKLTLHSDKLLFPDGASRLVHVDRSTNSVDVQVRARTSGNLPLFFTLTTPNGALVFDKSSLTVRSTATSIVGIVLTLVAAVVLLGWWARTWVRGRRGRRPARSG